MFGTARGIVMNLNRLGPFQIDDDKDEAKESIKVSFSENGPVCPSLPPTASSMVMQRVSKIRHVVRISRCGCPLEISAEAYREKLMAVGRRIEGSGSTGITVRFSEEIEEHPHLVECRRRCLIIQSVLSKRPRNDPLYSARMPYCVEVTERLSRVNKQENIRMLTAV